MTNKMNIIKVIMVNFFALLGIIIIYSSGNILIKYSDMAILLGILQLFVSVATLIDLRKKDIHPITSNIKNWSFLDWFYRIIVVILLIFFLRHLINLYH